MKFLFFHVIIFSLYMADIANANPTDSIDEDPITLLTASEGDARAEIRPVELDPSVPLDAQVLEIMAGLDQISATQSKVVWADGFGACAHPKLGIVLDREQFAQWQRDLGPSQFEEIIRLVLAHELAHMKQYELYGVKEVLQKDRVRENEAQADIIAGYYATSILLRSKFPIAYVSGAINRWYQLAQLVGCYNSNKSTHPHPGTRARLVTLGVLAQMQDADFFAYQTTHDQRLLKRVRDSKRKNADLPDPEGNERLGSWSRRVARKIVNPD